MAQIMQSNFLNAGFLQNRPEQTLVQVIGVQSCAGRRSEHLFLRDVMLAASLRLLQAGFVSLTQHLLHAEGHIHSPDFVVFRRRLLAEHVIVLHQGESVRISIACSEVDIPPLESDQLSAPQAHPHGDKEQGMPLWADLQGRRKKEDNFKVGQGDALFGARLSSPRKPPQPCCRI